MSYLVVESSIQTVQLVFGFPLLFSLALLHLRKTLVDPTDKTLVSAVFFNNLVEKEGEAQHGKYEGLKLHQFTTDSLHSGCYLL